jgi:hypothetical protein
VWLQDRLSRSSARGRTPVVVTHRGADQRAGERIDIELEVEVEALAVDRDGHLHAVTDPLCVGEEDLEGVTSGLLVGRSAETASRSALVVRKEHSRNERPTEVDAQVLVDVRDEGLEGPRPSPPRGDERLNLNRGFFGQLRLL